MRDATICLVWTPPSNSPPMTSPQTPEFDPAARRLCPDGACTGLVDAAGVCSECGKFWGDVPPAAVSADQPQSAEPEPEPAPLLPFPSADATAGFNLNRRLCPNGACTGVIGSDNRCSECGALAGPPA